MGGISVIRLYETIFMIALILYLVYLLIHHCDYKCNKTLYIIMVIALVIWAIATILQLLLWCFN